MPAQLLQCIKINGLQYNALRDPQVYRRAVGKAFRVEAVLAGTGTARCTLADANGRTLATETVSLPGVFAHALAFDTPGSRIVTLSGESAGQQFARDLRLDVTERDWIG